MSHRPLGWQTACCIWHFKAWQRACYWNLKWLQSFESSLSFRLEREAFRFNIEIKPLKMYHSDFSWLHLSEYDKLKYEKSLSRRFISIFKAVKWHYGKNSACLIDRELLHVGFWTWSDVEGNRLEGFYSLDKITAVKDAIWNEWKNMYCHMDESVGRIPLKHYCYSKIFLTLGEKFLQK